MSNPSHARNHNRNPNRNRSPNPNQAPNPNPNHEQTLDYVRTVHRFELTLSDPQIIGRRRAAQRMMGGALKALPAYGASSPGANAFAMLDFELMKISGK